MEGGGFDSPDAKNAHRIEMIMLAILVRRMIDSTFQLGPALSKVTTTLSSLCSPISILLVVRIRSL